MTLLDHFLEQFVLPMVAAVGALLVRWGTRIRVGRDDLAVGLDLLVGALFALVVFGMEAAIQFHRFALDFPNPFTYPVLAAAALLLSSGLIVREFGWARNQNNQLELQALQGIIIPLAASVDALLLVVRQSAL
jgi:hypothetical protein